MHLDSLISFANHLLKTVLPQTSTISPEQTLNAQEKKEVAALMRVNHVGEVCAQALYLAQAHTTKNSNLRNEFLQAAKEEQAHLDWTYQRIKALGGTTSKLNLFWFLGATGIGLLAGKMGDKVSLGFMAETERQVEDHLSNHLKKLPITDKVSYEILSQMKSDEAHHASHAMKLGGVPLPLPVKLGMKACAKVMTTTAYFI
jgi:3-demethoxyubiquinol 3-hydroxylase